MKILLKTLFFLAFMQASYVYANQSCGYQTEASRDVNSKKYDGILEEIDRQDSKRDRRKKKRKKADK